MNQKNKLENCANWSTSEWINAKIVRNELPHIYYMIWNLLLFYASSSRVTLLISIIIIIILSHTVQQPIEALYHQTHRHTHSLTYSDTLAHSFTCWHLSWRQKDAEQVQKAQWRRRRNDSLNSIRIWIRDERSYEKRVEEEDEKKYSKLCAIQSY